MTYRAGIIGTGGVAGMGILGSHDREKIGTEPVETSHAGGYAATDAVDLVAIADVDDEKRETFGDVWDVPASGRYPDHVSMLEAEDLDVVSVCTPTYLHHEHVIDAAERGDPAVIWAEKPLASSVAGGEAAIEACDDAGVELLVNHSSRFTTNYRRLRDLVREEEILGDVHSVNAQFRMELMRNSTHLLDTVVFFLDAAPSRASGYITGENEAVDALDTGMAVDDAGGGGHVVTADGTFLTVDCTVPRADSTMSYDFVGSGGRLFWDAMLDGWRYWSLEDGEHVESDLPGVDPDREENNFAAAVDHAVDLIEGRTESISPGREALRAVQIIVGFYISHYTGGTVEFPLADPLKDITVTSW